MQTSKESCQQYLQDAAYSLLQSKTIYILPGTQTDKRI